MRTFSALTLEHRPIVVSDAASVTDACNQMRDRRAGAVLVVGREDGRLVGIFTGRDAVCRVLAQRRDPSTTSLAAVMTRNPVTISPGRTATEALSLMSAGGFRHVPLVKKGRVLGVASCDDFHRAEPCPDEEDCEPWALMR
jgi:CBS domain-containing protein